MKICFLVGSMAISGGTYVIIQHASYLKSHGHDITLAIQEPFNSETLAWHDLASTLNCIPITNATKISYDFVVATWWKTVFELQDFIALRYGYFIQSIESRFYPEHEIPLRALVDSTYRFPLLCVTEASWIQKYLLEKFGRHASLVRNGIRKDIYHPSDAIHTSSKLNKKPRILVEGHFGVPFKNTALAVRLAKRAGCEDIWVLTGSSVSWIPSVSRIFSKIPMTQTPYIYRSCDILLKLSTVEGMFGPPLEIFHCGGTSVVFDVTGHDEYIVDGVNAAVVGCGDIEGVVKKLRLLLSNQSELNMLKKGALKTAASWPSWDESSAEFLKWIKDSMGEGEIERKVLSDLTAAAYKKYGQDERERLTIALRKGYLHRALLSIFTYLPAYMRALVTKYKPAWEVLFGKNKVY